MPADQLAVGYIKKPHGVRGYCKVQSFSGENGHLLGLRRAFLRKSGKEIELTIEHTEQSGNHVLMKFQGIDTPEKVKSYNGWELWVSRSNASPCDNEEYYYADLFHCIVVHNKEEKGKVSDILIGSQSDYLEVTTNDKKTVLVPFLDYFIGEVNLEENTIELKVEWILE